MGGKRYFGTKEIIDRLLKRGQTQEWLISEIQKLLPEKYVDNSNLYKILTGQINSKGITAAINEILDIS